MDTKILFRERRSVGHFDSGRSIDDTLLKKIIDLAVLAPSGFNLQPWRLIAVKSSGRKKRLQELSNNQPKVSESSFAWDILILQKIFTLAGSAGCSRK